MVLQEVFNPFHHLGEPTVLMCVLIVRYKTLLVTTLVGVYEVKAPAYLIGKP